MTSREGREYLMPLCPIAMPSHTPMQGTMTGLPPAAMTPFRRRPCDVVEVHMPGDDVALCRDDAHDGLFHLIVRPAEARRSERCDAILLPFVKVFAIKMPPKIHIVRVRAPRGDAHAALFCAAKEIRELYALPRAKPRFCFSILSASKNHALRCGTQFARYFGLSDFKDRYVRGR